MYYVGIDCVVGGYPVLTPEYSHKYSGSNPLQTAERFWKPLFHRPFMLTAFRTGLWHGELIGLEQS